MKNNLIDIHIKDKIILFIIIVYCSARAISLAVGDTSLAGINIVQMYGISFSYIFILFIILRIRELKLDLITVFIFLFMSYCVASVTWGSSQIKELVKLLLPYSAFFILRIIKIDKKYINLTVNSFIFGYILPILGSTFLILIGSSIANVDYYSGVERSTGMWTKIHPFAHSMLFFSFLYGASFAYGFPNNKYLRWAFHLTFILSIYCLLKSYTRTTYIGFLIFWSIFLLNFNKKIFLIFCFIFVIFAGLNYDRIENIFWKTEDYSINQASSGRVDVWKHNLNFFNNSNFERKILGNGIGSETDTYNKDKNIILSSHNDYISLLMTLGLFGFFLYSLIYLVLIYDILNANVPKHIKYLYLSITLSVCIMSLLSNGYLYRFDVSQSFWLLIGIFYNQKRSFEKLGNDTVTIE
jgi:hypothetical protein